MGLKTDKQFREGFLEKNTERRTQLDKVFLDKLFSDILDEVKKGAIITLDSPKKKIMMRDKVSQYNNL